ncbi:hypothetical protein BGX27_002349, partial [Mortierella sp. AM989]
MTSEKVKLFCILDGDSTAFSVKVEVEDTVDDLEKKIKEEKSPKLMTSLSGQAHPLACLHSFRKRKITLTNLTVEEKANKKPEELEDSTSIYGATKKNHTRHRSATIA